MALSVRDLAPADHEWARSLLAEHGGGVAQVARLGELVDPLAHEGLVAEEDGRPLGLLTVHESQRGLEVLTLHSVVSGRGAGTLLLATALEVAIASPATRMWLVTTNDSLGAIRFYVHRGMRLAAVHADGVTADRSAFKPQIPETNPENGIPIRDYIEFELQLEGISRLPERRFPLIDDLDRLPRDAAIDLLQPLFEQARNLVEPLVDERPFGDDHGLLRAAQDVARTLPEPVQIELLNAHPRIGADPSTVSAMSHAEQGYDAPATTPGWVVEELDALNDAYERVFGFRFVIFVAGRPREEILPILDRSLRDEREGELRRGLDDVVHIAADRLARLRTAGA